MILVYTDHARMRMRQRGITDLEIEHVLLHPVQILDSFDGTQLATGNVNNRLIRVKIIKTENYILIITVM